MNKKTSFEELFETSDDYRDFLIEQFQNSIIVSMEKMNVSSRQLASLLEKDESSVSRYFEDGRNLSLGTISSILYALKIDPYEVIKPASEILNKVQEKKSPQERLQELGRQMQECWGQVQATEPKIESNSSGAQGYTDFVYNDLGSAVWKMQTN